MGIAAAKEKDASKCKAALKGGADANTTDFFNYTALHLFAGQGDLDMCSTLVGYGAEVDPRSESMETPLLMAARAKHKPVVDFLLESGADAGQGNLLTLVDFLLESGANADAGSNYT